MIPTITTPGPIGRTLSAIRRELVRLQVQSTKDFVGNETPQGTFLEIAPPKTVASTPAQAKYKPFLTSGSTTYWVTPWPYGLAGPVVQIGDRAYRALEVSGGSQSIVATMKLRAYATRNPAEDYDPENSNPETYSILNSIWLIQNEDATFVGRQTSFDFFSGFPGMVFGGQRWFFPVKLVDGWNSHLARISSDNIVQTGERRVPLEEGEQDNPWFPTQFVKDFEIDILVGFIHQTGAAGSTSGLVFDGFSDLPEMPEETEITGIKEYTNDALYPYWHAEVKLDARINVPICSPDPNGPFTQPFEQLGFMLRNRDENGYIPGSQYPGWNAAHPLRNNYQRQSAFLLPTIGGSGGTSVPVSFRGATMINDLREVPECL